MEEISAEEQAKLAKVVRKHRKSLLALPNVHAVDVGFEYRDGVPTGRLAVRVHVTRKLAEAELALGERVPTEIGGVPVDVIQYNPVPHAQARESRFDPVRGGVQLMNTSKATAGTLGMIVFDADSLEPLALSNWHVMLRKPAVPTDVMAQPSGAANVLGGVVRYDEALDCAVCRLGTRTWSLEIFATEAPPDWTVARLGMKVAKSGLTTGVTWGVIEGIDPVRSTFTIVPDDPGMPELSLGGDSGSIWTQRPSSAAVGLHKAGNDETIPGGTERATAVLIDPVCRKLKVRVFDGLAIGTPWIGGQCRVLARTTPTAGCSIVVRYPSGRRSSAAGLQPKRADGNGWVEWTWRIGTSTARKPGRDKVSVEVTLGGSTRTAERSLEGHTSTEH